MAWSFLKKYKYFNPYKEYKDYAMILVDDVDAFPTHQSYEGLDIIHNERFGKSYISFKKNRLIVALDLIHWYLHHEITVTDKNIDSILFNNIKLYDKSDLALWENIYFSKNWKEWEGKFNLFSLKCEDLLQEDNVFLINNREEPEHLRNSLYSKYRSLNYLVIYKSTADRDPDYYLRELLDEWKIK
jgi:hypothetical protein